MAMEQPSQPRKQKQPLLVTSIIIALITVVTMTTLIVAGYWFSLAWAGFSNKTLWDWMQLLIVPMVLAIGAFMFNLASNTNERNIAEQQNETEHEIALDNQREGALQSYLDKMSRLLLRDNLRHSKPDDEVRYIARARTLTALPRLDPSRKGSLIQFLYESSLLNIVKLSGADLSHADLSGASLSHADLSGANLRRANLSGASLHDTDLSHTDLSGANLCRANLSGDRLHNTRLSYADLSEADLSHAALEYVHLNNATLIKTKLVGTKLNYADLSEANLSNADLNNARLKGADLSNANLNKDAKKS